MEEYKPTYNVAMETKPSEKKKYFETEVNSNIILTFFLFFL